MAAQSLPLSVGLSVNLDVFSLMAAMISSCPKVALKKQSKRISSLLLVISIANWSSLQM